MRNDDERLGQLLRAIRRRTGQTQADLALMAGVPRRDVIGVEAGRAGEVELERLRRLFSAVDARFKPTVWWRGAAADRLLDERHAALTETSVAVLARRDWQTAVEVSFSEFGERGSVDILGFHAASRAAVAAEVKGSLGSLEETNRTLDVKVRIAPRLVLERFGSRPSSVSRLLILPDDRTVRRIIDRHSATMAAVYPLRSRDVRKWLRSPVGAIAGLWFLSEVRYRDSTDG